MSIASLVHAATCITQEAASRGHHNEEAVKLDEGVVWGSPDQHHLVSRLWHHDDRTHRTDQVVGQDRQEEIPAVLPTAHPHE